ncbi:MAG: enoyl-CoA hydratase/isomerase family protein [Pseudomonadota bacterium]
MLAEERSAVSGEACLVIDMTDAMPAGMDMVTLPTAPVLGYRPAAEYASHPWIDLAVADMEELKTICDAVETQPQAAATLVQVLRHNASANVVDGLLAESLAYSTLQHSEGFRAWLSRSDYPPTDIEETEVLRIVRDANNLQLTLHRPAVHNAYNTALKDALCAALQMAHADPQIERVELRGDGPSYCAGGDLSEFGSFTDAAAAHLSRTTRSAGRLLADLHCQTVVHAHGACIGAGIEIPAFADRIAAREDTFFQLPEVGMGLIPGAGGTVSITRRIGRHRCAYMALSGARVDPATALSWGLIDAVV